MIQSGLTGGAVPVCTHFTLVTYLSKVEEELSSLTLIWCKRLLHQCCLWVSG